MSEYLNNNELEREEITKQNKQNKQELDTYFRLASSLILGNISSCSFALRANRLAASSAACLPDFDSDICNNQGEKK